ncbi:MAG: hypothetical protein HY823_08725 [Acidobacteria bacterium]|nr:hypothetical protein [Acidobacteriota bacterium]
MKKPFLILLVLGLAACNRPSQDHSPVLANIGGEKFTQHDLEVRLKALVPDPQMLGQYLTGAKFQRERADFVRQVAYERAILAFGRKQGLDSDPAVQAHVDRAVAQAYFQALVQRRQKAGGPGDAELRAMYEDIKGKNPGLPGFEEVKAQLSQNYGQWQFDQELKKAIPMTFSDAVGEPGS